MTISKPNLSLAAEFAVASELGRRNIYAQPTFGAQKRTDLLIFGENNQLLRIEVKAKQGYEWPNCKGIYGDNVILVLVDFRKKGEYERLDFYVLSEKDWISFVQRQIARLPEKKIELDSENVPVWTTEVNAAGKPYRGIGVRPRQIEEHKERWDKIVDALG